MHQGAKNPRRPEFRPISTESLKVTYEEISARFPYPGDRTQCVANTIVKHYLGDAWLRQYVDPDSREATYLRVDTNLPLPKKANALVRYWEFAETLLNLQSVDGFDVPLDQLSYGQIESTCAELDLARLIHLHEFRFRFVRPTQRSKSDYDFEIFYPDGFKVCADAKCKFEATSLRADSVRTSLRDARRQLPDDELSVVLVKVPESWISDIRLATEIVAVAMGYLRQSNHIVSVKFYAPVTIVRTDQTIRAHAFREVSNPKFPNRDWDIFRKEVSSLDGMPAWWTRIYPELRLPR